MLRNLLSLLAVLAIFNHCTSERGYKVTVATDSILSISKVKIQTATHFDLNKTDGELLSLIANSKVIFDGQQIQPIIIDSNVNYYLVTYDDKYYYFFSLWPANDKRLHEYTIRLGKGGENIYIETSNAKKKGDLIQMKQIKNADTPFNF